MSKFDVLPYATVVLLPALSAAVWNWVPTPKQTRGSTFFGARVTADFRESGAGVAILRQFRIRLWTWTLAVAAVCMLGMAMAPQVQMPVFSDGPTPDSAVCTGDCDGSQLLHRESLVHGFVLSAVMTCGLTPLLAFAMGRCRTLREATAEAEPTVRVASLAVEDQPDSRWVGFVDWLAMLGPPLGPAATLMFLAFHWQEPSPILGRSFNALTVIYGLVLGLCFGTANQWALRYRTRSRDWAPTAAASHKYRAYLGAMLAFVFGFITWQLCFEVVMSFSATVAWLRPLHRAGPAPLAVLFLFPLAAWGMQFWLKRHVATESGDPMADRYWKWGYFYCNPEDPALVVPLRSGIGFSHNYAHQSVRWALVAVTAATAAMLVQAFRL
jgi:hypothetical protein